MKLHRSLSVIALLALAAPACAQQTSGTDQTHRRFESMEQMMKDAEKAPGEHRQQRMHEHMQMMKKQMHVMRGMMSQRHGGGRMGPDGGTSMQQTQERMDMMQRMMEQMLKQQELLMKPQDEKQPSGSERAS